jgi:hypothetical protein
MSNYEVQTGWDPESRRVPVRRQSSNTAVLTLLFAVLAFQFVSLVFTLVWEARYQRAVDAVERAVQQLEAIDY